MSQLKSRQGEHLPGWLRKVRQEASSSSDAVVWVDLGSVCYAEPYP